jgi:transposase
VSDRIQWVGLDVHASQTTVAVLDKDTGELQRCKLRGAPSMVLGFLDGFEGRVIAVYEAGPTGMTLARQAREHGIDMRVCAPGLIPRKPSDRIKTDQRDAEILARQLAAGGLSFVRVPTLEEESLRDLIRAREDVGQDLTRARHRLSKFLLRRDLRYEGSSWSQKHLHWIGQLTFTERSSQMTCAEYLQAVRALMHRRDTLDAHWRRSCRRRRSRKLRIGCAAFAASTPSARWVSALRSATSGALRSPPSSPRFSGSSRPSTPPTPSAAWDRSRRLAPATPADCSSRPPGTTAARPASAKRSSAATAASTPPSSTSPGAANNASTPATDSSPSAASPPA